MDMKSIVDEIKLKLGGGVLDLDIDDSTLTKVVNAAFREIQRYIDSTRLATIPYKSCIDLSDLPVSSVLRVFRAEGFTTEQGDRLINDPVYMTQWQVLGGLNGIQNMNNWVYNYASWNTMMQVRNTMSTDLLFRFDRHTKYLYINVGSNTPNYITIEYVPRYDDVDEIASDYWIDKLVQLATALAKVTIGRVRSKFTQSNALWTMDGSTMLEEGNAELQALRTELKENHNLTYPID